LPLALVDLTLADIACRTFAGICATPGVGRKKIAGLLELLERAAADNAHGPSMGPPDSAVENSLPRDAANITEITWESWRRRVIRHGLGPAPLGRFARSLENLPRAIWEVPLEAYGQMSLAQMRSLRTHGDKRVRVVLEIFAALASMLGDADLPHLQMNIQPRFAAPVAAWLQRLLGGTASASRAEVAQQLGQPLVAQVRIDLGDEVAGLVSRRLGRNQPPVPVRELAAEYQLTRARVYQLLADAAAVMQVRWPEGAPLVNAARSLPGAIQDEAARLLFSVTADLFYPPRAHDRVRPTRHFAAPVPTARQAS
jgi:hypothetical protein